MAKLGDAELAARYGWDATEIPTTGSITKARQRLGERPLRLLFDRVKGSSAPRASFRGRPVVAVDTVTLDVADTAENEDFFGRDREPDGLTSLYPRMHAAVAVDNAAGSLLAAQYDGARMPPGRLVETLVARWAPGTLCLAGAADVVSPRLWREVGGAGGALVAPVPGDMVSGERRCLRDGSYLAALPALGVEARLMTPDRAGDPVLVTSLVDPAVPAADLRRLHDERWRARQGFGQLIAPPGSQGPVMRSKAPAMVAQEFWAMLCVYQAVHALVSTAEPVDGWARAA
jgi:hypothetical protein